MFLGGRKTANSRTTPTKMILHRAIVHRSGERWKISVTYDCTSQRGEMEDQCYVRLYIAAGRDGRSVLRTIVHRSGERWKISVTYDCTSQRGEMEDQCYVQLYIAAGTDGRSVLRTRYTSCNGLTSGSTAVAGHHLTPHVVVARLALYTKTTE